MKKVIFKRCLILDVKKVGQTDQHHHKYRWS